MGRFSRGASRRAYDGELSTIAVVVLISYWCAIGAVIHAETLAVFQGRTRVGFMVEVVVGGRNVSVRGVGERRVVLIERGNQRGNDLRLLGDVVSGSRSLVATRVGRVQLSQRHGAGYSNESVTWGCTSY